LLLFLLIHLILIIILLLSEELQALIRQLAGENGWGARKIQAELGKLGFTASLATVSRYVPKRAPDRGKQQRWMTFLRNHKDVIAAMEFFVIPTVGFRLLTIWFIIDHGRRRIIHFNVTTNPPEQWVIQQLRESFPYDSAPRYLNLRQRFDLLRQVYKSDQVSWHRTEADRVSKPMAERNGGVLGWQRPPGAAGSHVRRK